MSRLPSVAELSKCLLEAGAEDVLDVPLQRLIGAVGDLDTRELLEHLASDHRGYTLRSILRFDELDPWVARTCTEGETQRIRRQLQAWLLRDTRPLPPSDPAELERWAQTQGAQDLLLLRSEDLLVRLPIESALPAAARSLFDLCQLDPAADLGDAASRPGVLGRAFLRDQAGVRSRQRQRDRAWQSALPTPELGRLELRLREALSRCAGAGDPAPLECRSAGAQIDPASGEVSIALCSDGRQRGHGRFGVFRCSLQLHGYESLPLRTHCQCERGVVASVSRALSWPRPTTNATCLHLRQLLARLIDALHDSDDALHAPLQRVAGKPSWVRFFDALDRSQQTPPQTPASTPRESARAEQRLVWKVRVLQSAIQIAPALQTRGRNGTFSAGARIAPDASPPELAENAADQVALALLKAATPGKAGYFAADLPLLRILSSHPLLLTEANSALVFAEGRLTLAVEPALGGVSARFSLEERPIAGHGALRTRDHVALPVREGRLVFAALPAVLAQWLWLLESAPTVLPPESYDALRDRLIDLQPYAALQLADALRGRHQAHSRKLLVRLAPGFAEGVRVSLLSRPLPFGPIWLPGQGPAVALGTQDGQRVYVQRDLAAERESAAQLVLALQLERAPQESAFRYRIDDLEGSLRLLDGLAQHAERLEIEWLDGYRPLQLLGPIGRSNLRIKIGDGRRWFEASGHAVLESGQRIALLELLEASRTRQRYVKVAPGTFAELQADLRERLQRASEYVYSDRDKLKLAAWALPRVLDLVEVEDQVSLPPTAADLLARMRAAPALEAEVEPPAELRALLRPYQREGVQFLLRLAQWAGGACLADDMGLGKTLQALAVLSARRELGPALVVAPTSVCDNWLEEARRFAPSLRMRLYRGSGRAQQLRELGAGDVLVTSYELVQRDKSALVPIAFATQVLDEAQMLKNALSRRARAAAAIDAAFRIALTGTPLENHLGELWSLMSLLNPALLGSWRQFRSRFAVPIERYANQERLALLRQIIQPFVLRRNKRDVAPELPARLEITKQVVLSEPEQALYDAAASDVRKRLGSGRRLKLDQVSLLAEITRLRQLACHPRLVMPELEMQSSKVLTLCELLDDILPNGHRALLFSQFVAHLELVRAELLARGHTLLYLDGSTPAGERATLVKRWQGGEGSLFLISLKAGGTGLNLTGADYVFHLDPWWNPAAEDQASDRAHRLGQARPVAIVRLVAKSTVEERVLALHREKRELAQALLLGTDQSARLDTEQLARLLELR